VSYATVGGSVGPHFDYYDVFLLQGAGKRRWSIGQHCDESSPLLENTPLKVLSAFEETDGWVLQPGDMLYLPPCIAHHGVAEDDECMTYSVGFRSPTAVEMLNDLALEL
ncbi:MAG: cupin domain-containing protein, partial [bacterium]